MTAAFFRGQWWSTEQFRYPADSLKERWIPFFYLESFNGERNWVTSASVDHQPTRSSPFKRTLHTWWYCLANIHSSITNRPKSYGWHFKHLLLLLTCHLLIVHIIQFWKSMLQHSNRHNFVHQFKLYIWYCTICPCRYSISWYGSSFPERKRGEEEWEGDEEMDGFRSRLKITKHPVVGPHPRLDGPSQSTELSNYPPPLLFSLSLPFLIHVWIGLSVSVSPIYDLAL